MFDESPLATNSVEHLSIAARMNEYSKNMVPFTRC
jgi:hypothetical protein